MDIYTLVTIVFLVAFLAIGLYVSRKTHTVEDHFVMSRSASAFFITGTLIATNISSTGFIGFSSTITQLGPTRYTIQYGATMMMSLFLGLYIGRFLFRMKLMTISEFFTKRYEGKLVHIGASVVIFLSMTVYMISVVLTSIMVTHGLFGWSTKISLIVILTLLTLFTTTGGMRSVVVTDTAMFIVIAASALIIGPAIIVALGGIGSAVNQAAQSIPYIFELQGNSPKLIGYMSILEMNVLSCMLVGGSPQLISRVSIAKSERELGKAMVYLAVLFPVVIIVLLYPFGFFPLFNSGVEPADAFVWTCKNLVPPIFGAVAIAGVMAAALSTISSLHQQAAVALSSSIIKDIFFPKMSSSSLLKLNRYCTVLIALIVYAFVSNPAIKPSMYLDALLFANAMFAAWVPAIYLGVTWKRANTNGAVWSIFLSVLVIIAVSVLRNNGKLPIWTPVNVIGLMVSTTTMIFVSLFTKPNLDNPVYDEIHQKAV